MSSSDEPPIFYKYYPIGGLVALQSRCLKCTRPEEFSDVFEAFHIDTDPEIFAGNVLGDPLYHIVADPRTGLPNADWRSKFREWLHLSVQNYPGFRLLATSLDPVRNEDELKIIREGMQAYDDQNPHPIFVLSLTESWSSATMWDTYAGGHTGFTMGFRSEGTLFTSHEWGRPRKIFYQDEPSSGPSEVAKWRRWLIKKTDYQHEKEWRSLFFSSHLEEVASNLFTRKFVDEDLVEIIAGVNASPEFVDALLASKPTGATLYQAEVSADGNIARKPIHRD
ncbi:DUF2971 domain-containing protein [Erythrobacter sp. EC-HK427]|uniref:DUF2971 domain-containing protein n=1 Tax=Erythrobacter sp. EC-HK427 TaxID=2038396 RepID=UPI0012600318|nr:DUF2971 domain-containing protein [Erythrobacter sp. EC-HK427]